MENVFQFEVRYNSHSLYQEKWYVSGWPTGFDGERSGYVGEDLNLYKSMVSPVVHYVLTREEAEARLEAFQEKNGMFGFGTKKADEPLFVAPLTPFGEQQLLQQQLPGNPEMTDEDFFDALDDDGCGDEETDHIQDARATKHTQLLLEGEPVPSVTAIRSRLVTDGEDVILEVQTPSFGFYQSVARLTVNKFGQVVMYRTRRTLGDSFIKSDSQGRIQN